MSVTLSVCIVAYNNYKDIKEALATMNKYTSPKLDKKVYIVDNGVAASSPFEVDDFKKYIEQFKDVEYIDADTNLGFGKGNNKVLPLIDSKYHAIINPDILFCEDALSKIVDWMDVHKEVGMVIPCLVNEEGKKQEAYRREITVFDLFNRAVLNGALKHRADKHNMHDMDYTKSFEVPFAQGSFLVIRTNLFKKLNGFDENFFMYVEDADLCRRLNQISKLMYYPDAKAIHKWKKASRGDKTLFKYHFQSLKYYFKKWGWKFL